MTLLEKISFGYNKLIKLRKAATFSDRPSDLAPN